MQNIKKRNVSQANLKEPLIEEEQMEYDLPYGGKVFLARKKKDDSWLMIIFQVIKYFKIKVTPLPKSMSYIQANRLFNICLGFNHS